MRDDVSRLPVVAAYSELLMDSRRQKGVHHDRILDERGCRVVRTRSRSDAGHRPLSPRTSAGAPAQADGSSSLLGRDAASALTAPPVCQCAFVSARNDDPGRCRPAASVTSDPQIAGAMRGQPQQQGNGQPSTR
jgi:hypothetical protein